MAVRIYQRQREWWRHENESVPGTTSPQKKFLEKKSFREGFPPESEEDEDSEIAPEMEDDTAEDFGGGEDMLPPDVENPDEMIDGMGDEQSADEIADQITLKIDGVAYDLVPSANNGAEGMDSLPDGGDEGSGPDIGDDLTPEEGVEGGADNGLDIQAEDDDVSQPIEDEDADKRKFENRRNARKRVKEDDDSFLNGDEVKENVGSKSSAEEINPVMEALDSKIVRYKREIAKLEKARRVLEDVGELKMPTAKDVNSSFAGKGGPKNVYTPADSGENFKNVVGKGEKFATRGPGTGIQAAYTPSGAGDNKQASFSGKDGFSGRGPGSAPRQAYTPSESGDTGATGVKGANVGGTKRTEAAEEIRNRILSRRMQKVKEVEGKEYSDGKVRFSGAGEAPVVDPIGKAVPDGKDQTQVIKDVNDPPLDVAEETKIFEKKLADIRAQRLARRSEKVEEKKAPAKKLTEKAPAAPAKKLEESFDFKSLIQGKYE